MLSAWPECGQSFAVVVDFLSDFLVSDFFSDLVSDFLVSDDVELLLDESLALSLDDEDEDADDDELPERLSFL